ncbi:ACT domain-containing protein [Archaeoglobales archaeon]|nr:MAG: ACT domain-containing protein [Archaeoglobales archaeon]
MKLEYYFRNGKIYVWKEKFAIIKSKVKSTKIFRDAFAVVCDKNEITIVKEQSKVDEDMDKIIAIEKDWRIITFDMELPFELVGFLAKISAALAEEGISIFVISAYSTDHILVKEKNLSKAIKKLEELGFSVER